MQEKIKGIKSISDQFQHQIEEQLKKIDSINEIENIMPLKTQIDNNGNEKLGSINRLKQQIEFEVNQQIQQISNMYRQFQYKAEELVRKMYSTHYSFELKAQEQVNKIQQRLYNNNGNDQPLGTNGKKPHVIIGKSCNKLNYGLSYHHADFIFLNKFYKYEINCLFTGKIDNNKKHITHKRRTTSMSSKDKDYDVPEGWIRQSSSGRATNGVGHRKDVYYNPKTGSRETVEYTKDLLDKNAKPVYSHKPNW